MTLNLNQSILKNLNYNEEYCRKVLPFIKTEYFQDNSEKLVFNEISDFIINYGTLPTYEALVIQLTEKSISESELQSGIELLDTLHENKNEQVELDWIVEKTEKFCQEKAVYNAVLESITILDNKHTTLSKGSIPSLLSDALAISFDSSVGHNYIDDSDKRYEYYHRIEDRIPFHLNYFNKITNNGLPKSTFSVILAGPHTGKSLFMCDFAANFQLQGKNVLYITLEMAEEEIAKRVDANLLNVTLDELMLLDKDTYKKKIDRIKSKTVGRLFVKEYPTASANVTHFRTLLNELRLKKNFVPDIIFVDYLNICSSSRVKMSGSVNSFQYIQAIGQELRGLAQEYKIPLVSATQTTRSGSVNSDVDMTDVSESFGIPAIADFMIALISNEELYNLGQIMVKQLKNRFRDLNLNKRFVVGVDRAKMKLYDVEASTQSDIQDSGNDVDIENIYAKAFNKKKAFEGFTV